MVLVIMVYQSDSRSAWLFPTAEHITLRSALAALAGLAS
ncbi:hypothetical protein AEST_00860 [Alishewanella aestuarii B11]|uniref:Uncharacterized protein n=1 Tax=Alishewanella aestuarii B11 TaxID=1197174 RepID=J1YGF8_9ALTE|nr:hypothetical protein AEST_00860 [Alishewanella aestuarii B11]